MRISTEVRIETIMFEMHMVLKSTILLTREWGTIM